MSTTLEVRAESQTTDIFTHRLGEPVDLQAHNVRDYADMLVAAHTLAVDDEGLPVSIPRTAAAMRVQPLIRTIVGLEDYVAQLDSDEYRVEFPPMLGVIVPHTRSHFHVHSEILTSASRVLPPRLFRFGGALITPVVKLRK